jgi:hypothetical protein
MQKGGGDSLSRIRLVPMILIAVVSLAILFSGWQAYQRFNLVNPLKLSLSKLAGVESVNVNSGNPKVIQIKLGAVKDLQTTYDSIALTISGALGSSGSLEIQDNSDDKLRSAYESYQPIILEGLAKGNYTEMISTIDKLAIKNGINARITMDQHHVYVQLSAGRHYLYKVWSYSVRQGGGAS